MIGGLLAFEGYLFANGYRKGRESGNIHISQWGLTVAFIVTISAGMLASLSLHSGGGQVWSIAEQVTLFFVILSTAVGAPVIAYYGAENIGVVHNSYLTAKANADSAYREDLAEWHKKFWTYYRANAHKIFGVERRPGHEEQVGIPVVIPQTIEPRLPVKQMVAEYLQNNNLSPFQVGDGDSFVMTPGELAAKINVPNSSSLRSALFRLC